MAFSPPTLLLVAPAGAMRPADLDKSGNLAAMLAAVAAATAAAADADEDAATAADDVRVMTCEKAGVGVAVAGELAFVGSER